MTGLRKKTVSPGTGSRYDDHSRSTGGGGSGSTDLFGTADAIVKHVLEVKREREGGKERERERGIFVYIFLYWCMIVQSKLHNQLCHTLFLLYWQLGFPFIINMKAI